VRRLLLAAAALAAGCKAPAPLVAPPAAPFRFTDVAAEMGLDFVCGVRDKTPLNIAETLGGGAGFLDYDGDTWPDLVLCGPAGARLYRNEGGTAFRDVSATVLGRVPGFLQGVAAADYDGDGWTDLLFTSRGGVRLLRNLGGRRFGDATAAAGLVTGGWTTSAAFADVDGDGWLDLYVGRYVEFRPGMPEFSSVRGAQMPLGPIAYRAQRGSLFLNRRGRFVEGTAAAGLADTRGKTLGVIFQDHDGDGDPDLYLANDQELADFYLNDGRGRFRNIAVASGTAAGPTGAPQSGMGVDWGDFDDDGKPDLIVTTFHNEPKSLYRQLTPESFAEVSRISTEPYLALRYTGFGVCLEDLDGDGRLDLVVANGHVADQADVGQPEYGYRQPLQFLHNVGGRFREVTAGVGFDRKLVGRALAVADFNRDGRQDLLVADLGGSPVLLRNDIAAAAGFSVALRQPGANGAALGARVSAGGRTREVWTGRSYMAAFCPEVHFPAAAARETLRVRWPDGRVEEFAPDAEAAPLRRLTRSR